MVSHCLVFVVSALFLAPSVSSFLLPSFFQPRVCYRHTRPLYVTKTPSPTSTLIVGDAVGSGSYGTVHLCQPTTEDGTEQQQQVICKRAWNKSDLEDRGVKDAEERQRRCQYYFEVEQHCFEKMKSHKQLPEYFGTFGDQTGRSWMTFSLLRDHRSERPAPSLSDVIQLEWRDQHSPESSQHHHLWMVQTALGLSDALTFADTLDTVIASLLEVLAHVHSQGIVHRDVKPANLLCDSETQSLVLIDFGSAADMDPVRSNTLWGGKKRVGLEDGGRVAVSPIYSAPETFIRPDRAPYQFDVFSAALIICQLIFNLLDERMDAGFHQQLEDAKCDLDAWLSRELTSKVRPSGLQDALEYFSERAGLWKLLSDMLRKDPEQRVTAKAALDRFQQIRQGKSLVDGPFFASVMELMETCDIPSEGPAMGPRPLHYVATFRRSLPLGLVLAEADQESDCVRWKRATKDAEPGEVFIRDIVPASQAATMGIFDVGDRLQGVGELPLANGGFEKVVRMLEEQPSSAKSVKLHFDRQSIMATTDTLSDSERTAAHAQVMDQGAWSVRGRRKAQEDAFVLQEMDEGTHVVLAAVFDGHGGTAASHTAQQLMPFLVLEEFRRQNTAEEALAAAWQATCTTYRDGCDIDECIADYDEMEGALEASTGGTSLIAGTTATVVAVDEGKVSILNCGDSRTLLVGSTGTIVFATQDHSPDVEIDRFEQGRDQGYSQPLCSLSRWFLPVGDYEYAVSRSLEGPFATSKGIISDPDVATVSSVPGVLILASDGLFEVMDNEEVGREVLSFRDSGMNAGEAAREVCYVAMEKGTTDNVSVIVIYLT